MKWDNPIRHPFQHYTDTRGAFEIIDARGTIDVFHPAPFGIVDVLDAFDLCDRTNLLELLGATVPASPPRHLCTAFFCHGSFTTTLLAPPLRAPPRLCFAPPPPHPAPFILPHNIH